MKTYNVLSFTFIVCALVGCASGGFRVISTPDKADVFVTYEGGQPQKIGETPLVLDQRVLGDQKGRFLTLTLKKEGFRTEAIVLPTSLIQSSVDVSSKLDEFKLPATCQDAGSAVDKIAKGIAASQAFAQAGRLVDAQQRLDLLLTEYPDVSVLYDLLGNIQYMNKNLQGALRSYDRSLELDPNNLDTQRIRNKIRTIVGERVPASSGGQ